MSEARDLGELGEPLARWYLADARDLPWRANRDPYAILVSETMLQQTQTERVKHYYPLWMETFPTLESLASAPPELVVARWTGLGYYSRARNLQAAAQRLVALGYTTIPPDEETLASLPGIGPYTLGAVLSIAYNLPRPAVDGNVRRVIARVLDLTDDPRKARGGEVVSDAVRSILIAGQPRTLTQAIMELGAMICRPANPDCDACPISAYCEALAAGTVMERPVKSQRRRLNRRQAAAILARDERGNLLVHRRPDGGLWSGFHELPWAIAEAGGSASDALIPLAGALGIPVEALVPTGLKETLRYTHWHVELHLWSASLPTAAMKAPDAEGTSVAQMSYGANAQLVEPATALGLPMPAGMRRLLRRALASPAQTPEPNSSQKEK